MMHRGLNPHFVSWLARQPPIVQEIGRRFPIGTILNKDTSPLHVFGYTVCGRLIVSSIDPRVDYDGACAHKEYVCPPRYGEC